MPSKEEQLRKDIVFETTTLNTGVVAKIEVRLYDNESARWAIRNTPRNSRADVLADLERALDLLEAQSAQRASSDR